MELRKNKQESKFLKKQGYAMRNNKIKWLEEKHLHKNE